MSTRFPEIKFRLIEYNDNYITIVTSEPYETPKTILPTPGCYLSNDILLILDTVRKNYKKGKRELRYLYLKLTYTKLNKKRLSSGLIKKHLWSTDIKIVKIYTSKRDPGFIDYPMKKLELGFKNRLWIFKNYIDKFYGSETEIYRLFCILIKLKMLE